MVRMIQYQVMLIPQTDSLRKTTVSKGKATHSHTGNKQRGTPVDREFGNINYLNISSVTEILRNFKCPTFMNRFSEN